MKSLKPENGIAITLVALLFVTSLQLNGASRVLKEEEEDWFKEAHLLQSLQKAPVRPPGSGCTFTPGQGGAPCTSSKTFAMAPPSAHPGRSMPRFGIAAEIK